MLRTRRDVVSGIVRTQHPKFFGDFRPECRESISNTERSHVFFTIPKKKKKKMIL